MKKFAFLIIVCIIGPGIFAQNHVMDSLRKDFATAKHDTTRADVYIQFSEQLYLSKPDTVIPLCLKAIALCDNNLPKANAVEKKKYLLVKSSAFNNIGYIYQNRSDVKQALEYYHKGLKIQEEIGDQKGIAQSYNNIGFVYQAERDAVKALEYYKMSLSIREKIDDKRGLGECYNNIGFLYRIFGDPDCKSQIEKVCKRSGLEKGVEYYERSLKIKEAIHDSAGIAISLNNIGGIYISLNELDKAMDYYKRSLKIREIIKDKQGLAGSLNNIGIILYKQKKYKEALAHGEKAMQLSKEIGFPVLVKNAAESLKNIYYALGDYKKAADTYTLFIEMRDSLNSQIANKEAVKKQLEYEYQLKMEADSVKTMQEKRVLAVERQHDKNQRLFLIGGLVLVLIFAAFMFNRFKITQKQKLLIEKKERETQQQKVLLEDKQKEIVDSINYAQRIQKTLLASDGLLQNNLPAHFVLYKPKAIVSGDFYWGHVPGEKQFFLAVCDSTGHGVPGAFMSLLNTSFLNEAVSERKIMEPNKILDHVRERIIKNLSSEGGKDGMDCSLVFFDFENNIMKYASANNQICVVRSSELIELNGDKMPVGKHDKETQPFTHHEFKFQSNDMIYLFTDGFADQFGGPKGKKFMFKQLQQLFISINTLDASAQKEKLNTTFEEWKGSLEQVDDVCIIGVRI